ncbi:hypothetical protein ACT3TB_16330 [Micrococcaceae sp. AOP34-BR2-30]
MSKILYGGQFVMKRIGRKSPNSFTQISRQMPKADGLLLTGKDRPLLGWTLSTWEKVAQERPPQLKNDLLAAIEELRAEEKSLAKEYLK